MQRGKAPRKRNDGVCQCDRLMTSNYDRDLDDILKARGVPYMLRLNIIEITRYSDTGESPIVTGKLLILRTTRSDLLEAVLFAVGDKGGESPEFTVRETEILACNGDGSGYWVGQSDVPFDDEDPDEICELTHEELFLFVVTHDMTFRVLDFLRKNKGLTWDEEI